MYVIFNSQNQISFYAANENEKNNLILDIGNSFNIKTVSASDFLKLKKNLATASLNNDTVVITDGDFAHEESVADADHLNAIKKYHEQLKKEIKSYLKRFDSSRIIRSQAESYLTTLESVDYTSLSIAHPKTWETYCEENSIAYLHPLQLP